MDETVFVLTLRVMKRFLLLALVVCGCNARVLEAAEPTAATCAAASAPKAPEAPAACFEEALGAGDVVLSSTRRSTASIDGVSVTTEETLMGGALSKRVVRKTRGALVLFESTEHPLLRPEESMPYTYGEAATFSTTYRYDDAGHLVDKAYDRAMDGTIDREDTYRYEGAVLREHAELANGKLVHRELFDVSGNKVSELDSGDYGHRYTYDARGFLTRDEKLDAGVVTERTDWSMRSKTDPLHRVTFNSRGETLGEQTWKYEGDRLLSVDGSAIIGGNKRINHTEFDALRRETRMIEQNEEPTCRVYDRTTVYGPVDRGLTPAAGVGEGEPVEQVTTCDARPFETLTTTLDAAGRKLRVDHAFYGNPRSTTKDSREYAYDDCGRLTRFVSTYNGVALQRQSYAYDSLGRLVLTESIDREGTKSSSTVTYDAEGRVVDMNDRHWTYDSTGRLVRIDGALPPVVRDGPAVVAIRYRHC